MDCCGVMSETIIGGHLADDSPFLTPIRRVIFQLQEEEGKFLEFSRGNSPPIVHELVEVEQEERGRGRRVTRFSYHIATDDYYVQRRPCPIPGGLFDSFQLNGSIW